MQLLLMQPLPLRPTPLHVLCWQRMLLPPGCVYSIYMCVLMYVYVHVCVRVCVCACACTSLC